MNRIVLRVTAPKKIEVFSAPIPQPGPHEMVIKISIAGVCRSDLPVYLGQGTFLPRGPLGFPAISSEIPYPAAFGHEPTGIVESVGSQVTRFAPGDRISGACGGAFASHVTISEFAPFAKLPGSVPVKNCLAEPVMCSLAIARAAMPPVGGSTAVVGCGYMGLLAISLLHARGAANIAAFNRSTERLALARKCGAAHTFHASDANAISDALQITGGAGFDRAVELTGSLNGLLAAAHLIKRPGETDRGVIVASSVYDKPEAWPPELGFELMCRCPQVHFVHPGFYPDIHGLMQEAVDACASGALPADGLISHRFAPEELGRAYEMMLDGDKSYMKGAVEFE